MVCKTRRPWWLVDCWLVFVVKDGVFGGVWSKLAADNSGPTTSDQGPMAKVGFTNFYLTLPSLYSIGGGEVF
jgi:hypothetical protein